jgi:hypothetical protein
MEEYKNNLKCWEDEMVTKGKYHLISVNRLKKLYKELKNKKDDLNLKNDLKRLLIYKSQFCSKAIKKGKIMKKISKELNLKKPTKKIQVTHVLMERLNKILNMQ